MQRNILIIPLDEVVAQLRANERQDTKIVVPEILSDELLQVLQSKGRAPKPEAKLADDIWMHSDREHPNPVIESADFIAAHAKEKGPFAVAFANEKAPQENHYHSRHSELYFSQHAMEARYRHLEETETKELRLESGGLIIFGPNVWHTIRLEGLTLIIEVPALTGDKTSEEL